MLIPARSNVRWMVASEVARMQLSWSQLQYSSRKRVGLWRESWTRYWASLWVSVRSRPWPMAWAFATLPVSLKRHFVRIIVDVETCVSWLMWWLGILAATICMMVSFRLLLICQLGMPVVIQVIDAAQQRQSTQSHSNVALSWLHFFFLTCVLFLNTAANRHLKTLVNMPI